MQQFAIAAIGEDRPGIVAAMGEALLAMGVNIDDSSMTILGGHFAMLLLVDGDVEADRLQAGLAPVAQDFGLLLEVRSAEQHAFSGEDRDDYVIAAYGPDRPGLVTALAKVLADANINITDFGSRVGEEGTFAMWFNVTLSTDDDTAQLDAALHEAGAAMHLDVRFYRAEAEAL